MKSLTVITIGVLTLYSFSRMNKPSNRAVIDEAAMKMKQSNIISCSPDLNYFIPGDRGNDIPLLSGWGHYRMPVTTANDSAEIYFEQGINMYYGFHIIEALASFDKATKFESNFAMAYWGMALAYGPNINDFGYSASPEAIIVIQKAKELSANCSPVEKSLIDAIQVRYTNDTTQTREHLNQLYADAMKKVYTDFPASADAAALYVDALMVQHPWDLYTKTYQPKAVLPASFTSLPKETIPSSWPAITNIFSDARFVSLKDWRGSPDL